MIMAYTGSKLKVRLMVKADSFEESLITKRYK